MLLHTSVDEEAWHQATVHSAWQAESEPRMPSRTTVGSVSTAWLCIGSEI